MGFEAAPFSSLSKTGPTEKRVSREGRGGGDVDEDHLESPFILEVSR